jgi:exopolysaccharide biosynthesis polyprenyl glycosylphosphotransferase
MKTDGNAMSARLASPASSGDRRVDDSPTSKSGKIPSPTQLKPRVGPMGVSLLVKRGIDVVGSSFALVIGSPFLLGIAIAVKLTSEGPVLFRQTRHGQFGAPFTFLKFRSMHVSNDPKIHQEFVKKLIAGEQDGKASGSSTQVFKIINDPRVTRIGGWLRRTSMDELPQFINVLKGEMSLVGPRPPVTYELKQYEEWHHRRLDVKPGLTGLWQVKGRSRTTFEEMVRMDIEYAQTWSLWLDLKILLRTPVAVFRGDGAY